MLTFWDYIFAFVAALIETFFITCGAIAIVAAIGWLLFAVIGIAS